jgi:hypothetical protein
MPTLLRSQSSIYASRLFSRRRLDLRAHVVAPHARDGRIIVQARTVDVSCTGAGLTLTRELPAGTEVMLCLRLPGTGALLSLRATITRRQGFRAGLRFLQTSAEQRLLLSELCND